MHTETLLRVNRPSMSLYGSGSGMRRPDPRSRLRSNDPPRPPCGETAPDRLVAVLPAKPLQRDVSLQGRVQIAVFLDHPDIARQYGLFDPGDFASARRIVGRPSAQSTPTPTATRTIVFVIIGSDP